MIKKKMPRREKAVAIKYRAEEDRSPRVVAKGEGLVAQAIKALAAERGIPIKRDDDLVELLAQVEIDREIPAELYAAVAEVLAWIYKANDAMKKSGEQEAAGAGDAR
ncbi:MAG: EscU/YscU/HrcU family type III secretion system export apparatus switch protein [Chitinivibrionales bacterium]